MIKLRILEKMMQVVTTVSKFVRTVKDKVKKINKEIESNCRHVKEEKKVKKQQVLPKVTRTSKAKLFKQMIYLIKEDNIIYLHNNMSNFQKQRQSPLRGEVVYIDFNYKKDWGCKRVFYYNMQHSIKTHSREPTHSSYGFLL